MTELDQDKVPADQPGNQEPTEPVDVFKEISDAVGKNYSDKDALIKALTEKDNFIDQLKEENKETRGLVDELATKVDESINAQKVLEELKNRPQEADATPKQPVDANTITNLFDELYTSREKEARTQANLGQVNQKLAEVYGDKAKEVFKSKSEELGLPLEKVKELASESPTAVLNLLGVSGERKVDAPTPPAGGGQPQPTSQTSELTKFKEEMRGRGLNPTHPTYIREFAKRNLFNN
jgi:hypothetical protein